MSPDGWVQAGSLYRDSVGAGGSATNRLGGVAAVALHARGEAVVAAARALPVGKIASKKQRVTKAEKIRGGGRGGLAIGVVDFCVQYISRSP